MRTWLRRITWPAAIAAAVLLVFAPAAMGIRTLARRDTDRLYAPVRPLVVDALRSGRLPLWNPYEGTGKPLLAEGIHSVLHPVSLLGAAVAPSSIDFIVLAYLVAAALGTFALARTLGASPIAAAGGALAFAFSGFTVSMTANVVFLSGLASAPWVIAGARAAGDGSRWGLVATALATGIAFLSGDTQATLVALVVGAALATDAGGRRGLARALVGMAAGSLLASVQIAATWAELQHTYRGLDLLPWEKVQWSLEPGRLLEWIVPGLYRGSLSIRPPAEPPGADGLPGVFADSVYLSASLLVVAAVGARRRTGAVLGVAAIVLLWMALGHHLGARRLLDVVPIWNRFRFSEKLMGALALCICAAGALGIDRLRGQRLPPPVAAASLLALVALIIAPSAIGALVTSAGSEHGAFLHENFRRGLPHAVLGLAALLALDRIRHPTARVLALALLLAGAPTAAVLSGAHFGVHEARTFESPLRLETGSPFPRLAHPFVREYQPTRNLDYADVTTLLWRTLLHPSTNVARRIDTIGEYSGFEPRRLTNLTITLRERWWRASRRFGVTHVVFAPPGDEATLGAATIAVEGGRLVQHDEEMGFDVWAVPHRPWAFFAVHAIARERPQDAHEVVLGLMDDGADETVVVEASAAPPTAPGRVLSIERAPEVVRIDAESSGPGLLTVNDAFWPGWRAWIDGQETAVLAADLLVRAVRWPTGRHTLVMRYDPPEILIGRMCSAVGALFVAALAVRAWVATRAPDRSPFDTRGVPSEKGK